jgi:CYTH domain-containing protein
VHTNWRSESSHTILQGYLNSDKERVVRIRLIDDRAFLTIKGITRGNSRAEFEYEIPLEDGKEILELCEKPILEKRRSLVRYGGKKWEIDEFFGENRGLITAEVELRDDAEEVELPDWIGDEVSHDPRYFNSNLLKNPFLRWGTGD